MIRFSLLLTCSLLTATLIGEHSAFAMNQDDNDNAPHVTAPAPIDWGVVADFFVAHPIQGAAVPLPAEDKKRSE